MNFKIDDITLDKINKWIKTLPENPSGAIGGRFSYIFTMTSLGLIIQVQDNTSEEKKDFTDYSEW
jgi:hypothetical protein